MSSKTCCATAREGRAPGCIGSTPFITACTCASCTVGSPSGPGVDTMVEPTPRPSQRQRISLPGMICTKRPVSMFRISMNRESKRRMYGWWRATLSALPSHSMVAAPRRGSPCLSTYTPNSLKILDREICCLTSRRTVVAQQESVLIRAEHSYGATCITPF